MITDIHLQQFRSYKDESFEFSPAVNIIVGPNTSGKTNLLEALTVIARGSSFRSKDSELISFKKSWARLESDTLSGSRVAKIFNENASTKKAFIINGQSYSRLNLAKKLPVVLFEPNHLLLLIGSPDARRNFIDDFLEESVSDFGSLRRQYKRIVAQRNALLKSSGARNKQNLFTWDVRLCALAGKIVANRLKLIETINKNINPIYQELSTSKLKSKLNYTTQSSLVSYESNLLKKLEANSELDYQRGFTGFGPHRDDITIMIDGHEASEVASRGETRTLLLALKIIEAQELQSVLGEAPILLLDDVFGELDGARRRSLTQFLQRYQTFITTTEADVVVQHFSKSAQIILMS